MSYDVSVRCACGALRGIARGLSASRGNRVVCYCDDCQSFAHFLDRAKDVLDAHGGTDIFQTSPARLEITGGGDRLASIRLRARGPIRWYAECCRTPIGNTTGSSRLPFVGLIATCLDNAADGRARDEVLGPVRMRVFGRFAKGDRSEVAAHDKVPASMMLRLVPLIALARLRGDHKRSPFFDAESGAPRATPHVLDAAELRAVESRRDAS